MRVQRIIVCFSKNLVPEYHHGCQWFWVWRSLHCASLVFGITPWSLRDESFWPTIVYSWRGNISYIPNMEYLYRTMPSQAHIMWQLRSYETFKVFQMNRNNKHVGPWGNSQLTATKRYIFVPTWERDRSRGAISIACTIKGQKTTIASWLIKSHVADISRGVTSTLSTT